MGVLDDAIREHLALKRRHGADPGEVAREEQNALGPVRREPEPRGEGAAALETDAALPFDVEHAPPGPEDLDLAPTELEAEYAPPDLESPDLVPTELHAAVPAPPAYDDELADLPAAELDAPAPEVEEEQAVLEEQAVPHEQVLPEDQAVPDEQAVLEEQAVPLQGLEPEPTDPDPAAGRTEDASAEPDQSEPALEDVLEETPEFLQETPEHDRLWFEQRPPRDFDFDK